MYPFALVSGSIAATRVNTLGSLRWRLDRYDYRSQRALFIAPGDFSTNPTAYLLVHQPSSIRCILPGASMKRALRVRWEETVTADPQHPAPQGGRYCAVCEEEGLFVEGREISLWYFNAHSEATAPRLGEQYAPERAENEQWLPPKHVKPQAPKPIRAGYRPLTTVWPSLQLLSGCSIVLMRVVRVHGVWVFQATLPQGGSAWVAFHMTNAIDAVTHMHNVSLRLATKHELERYAESLPKPGGDLLQARVRAMSLSPETTVNGLVFECDEGTFHVWASNAEVVETTSEPNLHTGAGGTLWEGGPRLDGDWYQ